MLGKSVIKWVIYVGKSKKGSTPQDDLGAVMTPIIHRLENILAHKPPKTEGGPYPYIVNDNNLALPKMAFYPHGRFALFGCSCLRAIQVAFQAIDFNQYDYSHDGYTNVPKLFIADNSSNVIKLWKVLKQRVARHEALNSFIESIDSAFFDDNKILLEPNSPNLFREKVLEFCQNDQDYQLFKAMVQKATFMQMDWLDGRTMQYVNDHNSLPIVIYASNIHELLAYTQNMPEIETYLHNIMLLEPAHTVYNRTSLSYARKIEGRPRPDKVDLVHGSQYEAHRATLFKQNSLTTVINIHFTSKDRKELAQRIEMAVMQNDAHMNLKKQKRTAESENKQTRKKLR